MRMHCLVWSLSLAARAGVRILQMLQCPSACAAGQAVSLETVWAATNWSCFGLCDCGRCIANIQFQRLRLAHLPIHQPTLLPCIAPQANPPLPPHPPTLAALLMLRMAQAREEAEAARARSQQVSGKA